MTDFLESVANSMKPREKATKKTVRGIYVEDEIWDLLKKMADDRGLTVTGLASEIIRKAVTGKAN